MRAADEHYRERGRHVRKREAAGPERQAGRGRAGGAAAGRRQTRRKPAGSSEFSAEPGGGGVPEDV